MWPAVEALAWIAGIVALPSAAWIGLQKLEQPWWVGGLGAVSTLFGLLVILWLIALLGGHPGQAGSYHEPAGNAPTATAALDERPDSSAPPQQCSGFREGPHAPVKYKTCIEQVDDQLHMSIEMVSLDTVVESTDVTAFVWLYDGSTVPRYRADNTLVTCTNTFVEPDRSQTCGPYPVHPPKGRPGRYATASTVELTRYAREHPRGWDRFHPTGPDAGFTGSQSGAIVWP